MTTPTTSAAPSGTVRADVRRGIADELTPDRARQQHGEHWQLSILTRRDGQHICYCCNGPATGRSSMNIWGTVCDFETCDQCHARVDGKRADSIPEPNNSITGGR